MMRGLSSSSTLTAKALDPRVRGDGGVIFYTGLDGGYPQQL